MVLTYMGIFTSIKFITAIVGILAAVSTAGVGLLSYESSKKTSTIADLREQIITLQTEIMRRNQELQAQANQFKIYNANHEALKKKLEQKYLMQPVKTNCNNVNITTLLRRSLSND